MTLAEPDASGGTALSADVSVARGSFRLGLSLSAVAGEVVAVLGPNGAGKSTLLRTLAGLVPLSAGRLVVDGDVVDDPARRVFVAAERRPVGVVFQDYLLFPHLTVLDNVAFGPRRRGLSRTEARRVARVRLERLAVGELAGRRPAELSGGQAQRVALARALAVDPRLLLLDEPMAALDAATRVDVRSELRRHLSAYDGVAVLVTHDPLDAMVVADRLVVLEDGAVAQQGTAVEVARRPRTAYVARLVGQNLLRGTARSGSVALADGGRLVIPDTATQGAVLVAVRPEAVTLHQRQPEGSARNVWQGRVRGLDVLGDRVRVDVTGAPSVAVDVTPGAVAELGLVPGVGVWLSVKATELEVFPDL